MGRLSKGGKLFPLLCLIPSAFAADINNTPAPHGDSGWRKLPATLTNAWENAEQQDIYLPVITWHNRFTYNDEHLHRYNERPWGAGYGVSHYDKAGHWQGWYAMVFKDSFNKWEPIFGYAWERQWRPTIAGDFRLGAGFTVGATARANWNYLPLPIVLPLVSVGYQRMTFQGTYIPGGRNNGNVFFGWFRMAV